jgi:hypothetical protein
VFFVSRWPGSPFLSRLGGVDSSSIPKQTNSRTGTHYDQYEELTQIVEGRHSELSRLQMESLSVAVKFIVGWRKFLNASQQQVCCLEVNRDNKVIGEPSPIPTLCFMYDTTWAFGLLMKFGESGMSTFVEVLKLDDHFTIRLGDNEYRVGGDGDYEPMFNDIYEKMKADLKQPLSIESKMFGFATARS